MNLEIIADSETTTIDGVLIADLMNPRLHPTLPVPIAGKIFFDLGRSSSYQAAGNGQLPVVAIGGKIRAITAECCRMVGLGELADAPSSTDAAQP